MKAKQRQRPGPKKPKPVNPEKHKCDIHEHLSTIERKLDAMAEQLANMQLQEVSLMASIDDVLASVAELPSINDSLDALFAQLQQLIAAGKTDPAKLQQALDLVGAQKERTKAAITANTPTA